MCIQQHDSHVDAYMRTTIVVKFNEWSVSKFDTYFATFGDYDLDCQVGVGKTEEEAKEDLCAMANVWYESPNGS